MAKKTLPKSQKLFNHLAAGRKITPAGAVTKMDFQDKNAVYQAIYGLRQAGAVITMVMTKKGYAYTM